MSREMTSAFRSLRREDIQPTDRLVAYILADCHNSETDRCDPSISRIVEETSLGRSTVIRSLQNLEKNGHITAEHRGGARSSYQLHPLRGKTSPRTGPVPERDQSRSGENQSQNGTPTRPAAAKTSPAAGPDKERKGNIKGNNRNAESAKDEDFQAACSFDIDLTADSSIRQAWVEWQDYRKSRHIAKGARHLNWTLQAARLSASSIMRAVEFHGSAAVSNRIHAAIEGSWQGLNLDKMVSAPVNGSRPATAPKRTAREFFGS